MVPSGNANRAATLSRKGVSRSIKSRERAAQRMALNTLRVHLSTDEVAISDRHARLQGRGAAATNAPRAITRRWITP
jgi:hypothetical protein